MKNHRRLIFFAGVWLALVVGGLAALLVYAHTPGPVTDAPPPTWPASSELPHNRQLPTLVMFAHPKCPCTRASIEELNVLMTKCQGQLHARVVFFQPDGVEDSWLDTDLWQSAAAIPGVTVQADGEGREARNFHATTSGQVVLYDPRGRLLFSGGITEARGHAGDNEGRNAIAAIVKHKELSHGKTPAFGCPIGGVKSSALAKEES